ncbi:MAG: hypothetical protein FWB95_02160 [Treponema sp.]|nr:hypothetical protein [Treponema sp.]
MKKTFLIIIIFTLIILNIGSCKDPIFFNISEEIEPNDPKISGSPTKFAVSGNFLWVASGKSLWRYSKTVDTGWCVCARDKKGNLPSCTCGRRYDMQFWIRDITATETYLYLCMEDSNGKGVIRRMNYSSSPAQYEDIIIPSENADAQSIFALDKILFFSAMFVKDEKISYSYYFAEEPDSMSTLISVSEQPRLTMLNGIAFSGGCYYLCSMNGLYYMTLGGEAVKIPGTTLDEARNRNGFTGIININDKVAAISRSGNLLNVTNENITPIANFQIKRNVSTGALAVWYELEYDGDGAVKQDENGKAITVAALLLAGRQDRIDYTDTTEFTHGYVELKVNPDGNVASTEFLEPGNQSPSSVDSHSRFKSSLGPNTINHIIQTPYEIDNERTLFASTHQGGVFSYRKNQRGEWYWNAEE